MRQTGKRREDGGALPSRVLNCSTLIATIREVFRRFALDHVPAT